MSGLPSATAVLDVPAEVVTGNVADPANPVIAQVVDPQPKGHSPGEAAVDAIERARQQEKDKLYGRLQERDERLAAMEEELKVLRAEREAKAAAEKEAADAAAEAERLQKIAETSAKDLLLQQQTEWEQRFAEMIADRDREREELAKEAEFNALRAYIQEQARTNSDEIAPQLMDLITGNTREEVDASIATMKAKTAEILDSIKSAQTQQRSQLRGVSPTSIPGASPNGDGGLRNLTAQDIKNMPMGEWAKYRKQVISGAENSKNRGLFE